MGAAAAGTILAREPRTVETFRRVGATSPAAARSLTELGLDESWVVDRLMDRAVLRQAESERLILLPPRYTAGNHSRKGVAMRSLRIGVCVSVAGLIGGLQAVAQCNDAYE